MKRYWSRVLLEDGGSKDVLQVVSYEGAPPVLEKRHYYMDSRDGLWKAGKVRGLSGLDLAVVLNVLDQFQEVLLEPWKADRRAGDSLPPDGQAVAP